MENLSLEFLDMSTSSVRYSSASLIALTLSMLLAASARTDAVIYPFTTPVFGLATSPDGTVLAADAGIGIVEIRKGIGTVLAQLPGVTDVAPIGRGDMFAITSPAFNGDGKLYRVSQGSKRDIANLLDFETRVNPDRGEIDSDPFDVEALTGGSALVADAAANALLIVDQRGTVDWVATFPAETVSTDNAKKISGCPDSGRPICSAPDQLTAQAVPTSVAIGPDGSYYVGELKGFPAPKNKSKIWKIDAGARHAVCGGSSSCHVLADNFTSVIDLTFGRNGKLYVVELDAESWLAMEAMKGVGGAVSACDARVSSCTKIASGILMSTAATVADDGTVWVVKNALIPGAADVVPVN
jgi:hypothetical protein